jgi:hypothetical protein
MPAGRAQAAEQGGLAGRLVEVEGLRIELGGEGDDVFAHEVVLA